MINNIKELALYLGVPECFQGEYDKACARVIYKTTACGCVFQADEDGVEVAGYAEGADAECEFHRLDYPFTGTDFETAVEDADAEGCELWHEWNDVDYMDDVIADDIAQRCADINEVLK